MGGEEGVVEFVLEIRKGGWAEKEAGGHMASFFSLLDCPGLCFHSDEVIAKDCFNNLPPFPFFIFSEPTSTVFAKRKFKHNNMIG